ncbi:MAG: excinuclease ABC subunit B [Candidatus Magasanikbacteria bacterium RIFOXYD2_FULL_41_14]|uniref:UvrABC system protein B n=1 Tax=Candidatus Magasanikbacteria bacterium RIFOXYD2_FULL_41_14 TaxID=1798709 RepID=A0A1F6PCX4_9BACT|nr:MAG: excinuclease ABC subunit B [Candidatus Magasanikbacteria bacterium RIFOXYD2_FULL_41_14]
MKFKLKSKMKPAGDQPQAIKKLTAGLEKNFNRQTLLGVTGSGKTFTIANVIDEVQLPTLVIAHNKTLAAQLCNEFREFFPNNAVEYFVSYYDYYQPEAYIPGSDTYIEKESQINEEIDRLRHACTQALLSRRDVIVVASVSAIYSLGSPEQYLNEAVIFKIGEKIDRTSVTRKLVELQFERTSGDLTRGTFRLRGGVLEIVPVHEERIYRLEIDSHIKIIEILDVVTRKVIKEVSEVWLYPAKHYLASVEDTENAFAQIRSDLDAQLKYFEKAGKVLEYERLKRRTRYDLEMIKNIGYCSGIENYSRYFDGRAEGSAPFTLLDYFAACDKDFLTVVDESHVTIPQIGGMYNGDRARKNTLIEHGFRLPSARDNRPLTYPEFEKRVNKMIFVSATPSAFEIKESQQVVEQIVRPTGLIDPEVIIRPVTGGRPLAVIATRQLAGKQSNVGIAASSANGRTPRNDKNNLSQIEDLIIRIDERVKINERVLVTTLTKKMAEDLNDYLLKKGVKVKYLHSEIDTLERIEIITDLRRGKIDVIVGVNLLREGLDLPEVSFVAILDADKEGFLRSETSLIQTIGRAARNINGRVVLYADNITGSIKRALSETDRRRTVQLAYNKKHNITPKTIEKNIRDILSEFGLTRVAGKGRGHSRAKKILELDLKGDSRPLPEIIKEKEMEMRKAAKELEFELAAILRDEIGVLKKRQ